MSDTCANCCAVSSDAVKLKDCTACRLVKYCGVDCQKAHRKQHKGACKERAAELKDERLYGQGHERPEGDFCPLCTLAIPLPMGGHSGFYSCCTKRVCLGCVYAAKKRGMDDCPFCRFHPEDMDDASEVLALVRKRVDAKDPEAIAFLAYQHYFGTLGLEKNIPRAMELWAEAAELGSIDGHFDLGARYYEGDGVPRDGAKAARHWEEAAMRGHVEARCNLGGLEYRRGNCERGARHFVIAAKMGDKVALDNLEGMVASGVATEQQYAEALEGYQRSVDEMKSPGRVEAKALWGDKLA